MASRGSSNGTISEEVGTPIVAGRRFLSREDVLSADDIRIEDVHVPEWGGWVRVRTMTGYERDVIETQMADQRERDPDLRLANMRAMYVAASTVDDTGRKLFSIEDVESLGRKSAAALTRVFRKTMELSSVTDEDVEAVVGKSETAKDDDSTTV